jgi:transposase
MRVDATRQTVEVKAEAPLVESGAANHYLFAAKFGRPGKGNDKGNVEGWWAMRGGRTLTGSMISVNWYR